MMAIGVADWEAQIEGERNTVAGRNKERERKMGEGGSVKES